MKKNSWFWILFFLINVNVFCGEFVATTAFKNISEKELTQYILKYLDEFKITYSESTNDKEENENDLKIYKNENNWTIIIWPLYFADDFRVSMELSETIKKTISSMHIYDGDYWAHLLIDEKGNIVDQYCTKPSNFEDPKVNNKKLKEEWKGNVEGVSKYLNVDENKIKDYYWSTFEKKNFLTKLISKILKKDEPKYLDSWSFAEYWKELGINYPDNDKGLYKKYRLDDLFLDKLLLKKSKYKFDL